VLTERRGHILLVTVNRPDVRNAVNLAVSVGLGDALEGDEHDHGIWAVVLTGAGNKAFCADVDLKAIACGEPLIPDDPVRAAWGFAGYVTQASADCGQRGSGAISSTTCAPWLSRGGAGLARSSSCSACMT
jgi:enoyl-CoA hydratase/carnithine racemase